MNIKGDFGEVSYGNEEHLIRNCREGNPSYKVAKSCIPSVLRWVEHVSHEMRYLAEKISKQNVEDVSWVLLTAII